MNGTKFAWSLYVFVFLPSSKAAALPGIVSVPLLEAL
jgi:hypothetical protein